MARRPKSEVRRVSIDRMSQSLERTMRAEGKSEKTTYSYTLSVRLLSEFLQERGHDLTVDVSRDDIRDFIALQQTPRQVTDTLGRVHAGGSPATAMVRFKSLQQFFKHCVEEDELEVSPMVGMRIPKVEVEPVFVVDDEVLAKLLKARAGTTLGDRRDTALLRIFIDTPCRLAEVTNLKLGDVDLRRQVLTVMGKGAKLRTVTFGEKTYKALDRYLRQLEREYPERVEQSSGWLWIGRQGRMSTSGISNVLHRMCADAGVPRLHWHQLRHIFAHTWLAEGGTEGDLMALAGWQSRAMLDRYAKSAQVERAHAASRRMSLGDRV
jgi:site-specific recombinase XerD